MDVLSVFFAEIPGGQHSCLTAFRHLKSFAKEEKLSSAMKLSQISPRFLFTCTHTGTVNAERLMLMRQLKLLGRDRWWIEGYRWLCRVAAHSLSAALLSPPHSASLCLNSLTVFRCHPCPSSPLSSPLISDRKKASVQSPCLLPVTEGVSIYIIAAI